MIAHTVGGTEGSEETRFPNRGSSGDRGGQQPGETAGGAAGMEAGSKHPGKELDRGAESKRKTPRVPEETSGEIRSWDVSHTA